MRAVVGCVEQQHNRDRHQCNGSNKDTKHCTHSPDKNCHQKARKPPERHLRGLLGSSIGYIRQSNDTARAISPPNHVRYVAAMCQLRDVIPLEAATLRPVSYQHLRPRLDGHLLSLNGTAKFIA